MPRPLDVTHVGRKPDFRDDENLHKFENPVLVPPSSNENPERHTEIIYGLNEKSVIFCSKMPGDEFSRSMIIEFVCRFNEIIRGRVKVPTRNIIARLSSFALYNPFTERY